MPQAGSALRETLRAMVKPGPLVVAVITAGVGLASQHIIGMVPGAILYVLLVYALGPAHWRAKRVAFELGLDLKDAPPGLKRWHAVLNETLRQIERDVGQGDSEALRLLGPVREEVGALGGDIRRLIRRAYAIHRYLNQTNPAFVQARIAQLEGQIANTNDAYSRQQLAEAAEALKQQVGNCEQLRVLLSRTEATLENMQASLQSIGSSVVKISAGGTTEAQFARDDSMQRLTSARSTVAALEQVLERVELA